MKKNFTKILPIIFAVSILSIAMMVSFYVTKSIEESSLAQEFVYSFGYLGILFLAIIAGLNTLVPIPAATFVPIFLASGFSMVLIIAMLTLGTVIADVAGYYLGKFSSTYIITKYPKTYNKIRTLHERNSAWLPFFVFIYASFVPFPNEAYLVPFGILRIPLRIWIIPIMLGAIIFQTLSAYGVHNIFLFFF